MASFNAQTNHHHSGPSVSRRPTFLCANWPLPTPKRCSALGINCMSSTSQRSSWSYCAMAMTEAPRQFSTRCAKPGIRSVVQIVWADPLVGSSGDFSPLWLGSMPALLKGFIERLLRKASHSLGTDPAKSVFDVKTRGQICAGRGHATHARFCIQPVFFCAQIETP